ncbi:MAG: PqqD family protein [Myxococcaceae bacterium]|nr:PqqD family protein [Myxococcaceae bacterium]
MREILSRVPRLRPDVGVQRVGGRLMAAGPGDELHTFEDEHGEVSEVGERILELIDGSRTVAQIVDALLEEFEVERAVCEEDAAAFVKLLEDRHVIVLG